MASLATKFQTGTAACAIAAAAAIAPAAIAQADPDITAASAAAAGNSAANGLETFYLEASNASAAASAGVLGLIQNDFIWLGETNANYDGVEVFSFQPLNLLGPLGTELKGWLANTNLQACVAGVSANFGPYGKVSMSVGRSC